MRNSISSSRQSPVTITVRTNHFLTRYYICIPMNAPTPKAHSQLYHRVLSIMLHSKRYWVHGQARLARDVGVSKSTIHRFMQGECVPTIGLALAVQHALESDLGRHLPANDIYSFDGKYRTASVCTLCGCGGCALSGADIGMPTKANRYQDPPNAGQPNRGDQEVSEVKRRERAPSAALPQSMDCAARVRLDSSNAA